MKRRAAQQRVGKPDGPTNPWLKRDVPHGYVLVKCDASGLLLHWSEWRLVPMPEDTRKP